MDDVFIKLQLTTVYGKLAGDPASPLVLGIHGWSQRNGWQTWAPLLAPLAAAGYCAVSVDMPGWGQSPAMDALPLGGERAAQVVIDLMDGLQQERAVLMGKSWGGGIALETALIFPERVAGLILTAPARRNVDPLRGLHQPVLLAWAEDDGVIPVVEVERYRSVLADLEVVTYPTGGHSAAPKNADDFAPRAAAFLQRAFAGDDNPREG